MSLLLGFFGDLTTTLGMIIAMLVVIGVIYLLIKIPQLRPLFLLVFSVTFLFCGFTALYHDVVYLTTNNVTIGDVINSYIQATQQTTTTTEKDKPEWLIENLGFRLEEGNTYSSTLILEPFTNLDFSKNIYSLYINDEKCLLNNQGSNYLRSQFYYSFYDNENNNMLSDTLYINFAFHTNETKLVLKTNGGQSAVNLWRAFQAKNNFLLSIRTSEFENQSFDQINKIDGEFAIYNFKNGTLYGYTVDINSTFTDTLTLPSKIANETISTIEANAFSGLTLNTIDYLGSIEEFKTIQKNTNWNSTLDASYIEIVKCSDGNVYFDRYGNMLTENEQPEEQPEEIDNVLRLVYNDGTTYEQELDSEILDALILSQINNISNCIEITIPDCVVIFKNNLYSSQYSGEFRNLKTINIGKNLSTFTTGLFATSGGIEGEQSVNKLEKINVDENNEHLIVIDDVLFSKDLTVLYCYPGQKTDIKYNVPSGVTKIGDYAFISNHYLQEVVLPDTVIELEFECFMDCQNLYVVKTNDSIQNIHIGAFMECYNLITLNLSSELKKIGSNAFSYCRNLNYITYKGSIYACQSTEVSCDSMMGYGGPKGTLTFECTNGTYSFRPGE